MVKKNRVGAATGALAVAVALAGVCLGLEGCTTATAKPADPPQAAQSADKAQLTGYATSNIFGHTSGAVSVVLHGASAARIDQLAKGLPAAGIDDECTIEEKMYEITFTAGPGTKQGLDVIGFGCAHLVVEIPSRGPTAQLVDRNCALLSAVRRLIPASATATHSEVCAG